jgi:hypothetical protein
MDVEQCRARVFLHEPLRRSLATWLGGRNVASMQRCTLAGGHRGEHVGFPDASGRASFRWDECGVHIGSVEGNHHGQPAEPFGSKPESDLTAMSAASTGGSATTRSTAGRHAADAYAVDEPDRRSPPQALWALTAAIERLTDSLSTAGDHRVSNGLSERNVHSAAAVEQNAR